MIDNMQIKKGYKKTEIGVIPEDWEVKKLGEIFELYIAGSKTKYISEGGKYIIMDMGSVSPEGKIIKNKRTFLYKDILRKGDLVMPKDDIGECLIIGKVALIPENDKYILGDHVFRLRIKNGKYYPLFFYYLINNYEINAQLKQKVTGSAQKGLSQRSVLQQDIKFPFDINEQHAIASILSDVDALIENLDKLIEKKKNIKKGAMQELLTGKKRLPGFTGEWVRKKLGEMFNNITTGKLDANAMIPNGKYKFFTCAREVYSINKYAFDTEALLISGNGEYVGYIHYYKGKFNAYQRTYVLFNLENSYDFIFLKYLLELFLKKRIDREVNAGNTPYIKLGTLTGLELILPLSINEQKAIAQILSDMDAEIEALDRKKQKYQYIKKGLMQVLLTGRVRLKEFSMN